MPRKKKKYEKKTFESSGSPSDTSANIYMSMLMSPAMRALTASQARLYVYCKAQYYAEKDSSLRELFKKYGLPVPTNLQPYFTMNKAKWCGLYFLYADQSDKSFSKDMAALIDKGFIVCHYASPNQRHKTIYKFSDNWQLYGTPEYFIDPLDMTPAMRNKENKKQTCKGGTA